MPCGAEEKDRDRVFCDFSCRCFLYKMRPSAFAYVYRIVHSLTSKCRHQIGKTAKNAMGGKMTCINNKTTIYVIVDLLLRLYNVSSLSLVTHYYISIYGGWLSAVQRPQSGTTGNLMCKTLPTVILPTQSAFYGLDDLTAVVEDLICVA